jgi:hypothetical protein
VRKLWLGGTPAASCEEIRINRTSDVRPSLRAGAPHEGMMNFRAPGTACQISRRRRQRACAHTLCARRSDTPEQFGAKRQKCPRLADGWRHVPSLDPAARHQRRLRHQPLPRHLARGYQDQVAAAVRPVTSRSPPPTYQPSPKRPRSGSPAAVTGSSGGECGAAGRGERRHGTPESHNRCTGVLAGWRLGATPLRWQPTRKSKPERPFGGSIPRN